jgi:hypothetical protein
MKKRFWDEFSSWEEAEAAWDARAESVSQSCPLKTIRVLPAVPGIAPGEKNLRWKALRWVIHKDGGCRLIRLLLRHPVRYFRHYVCSIRQEKPYIRDGDFFLFGLKSVDEMMELMQRDDALLIVGFSYCEKPFECPCGRFTADCSSAEDHPVCQQCFIGKAMHGLPHGKTIPVIIPTINSIGERVLEVLRAFPHHRVMFVITACEMALEMFGDFGNMVGLQGIGVRLGGRVCNTMRAFALSEEGVKPGLTVLVPQTRHRLLDLLRFWRETFDARG